MSEQEESENFEEAEDEQGPEGAEEGEGGEEDGEEEEKIPEKPLNEEIIGESLSLLCKTGDGLAHAYVRLDIHDKEVTDINILKSFIHLRYVDITKNKLKSVTSLNALTHLLTLKVDGNLLTSAKLDEMPYLQVASFNQNKITSTEGVNHPLLEQLSMSFNDIHVVSGLEPSKLARLHTLELRGNKLETTDAINLPNLKNLFLAANTITKLEGLDRLEHLSTLHLRDNQISSLDGFSENMKQLQYVNLRGNALTNLKGEIKKMSCLPILRAIALSENPISDEEEYRIEVLIALRRLERLDKDEYQDDEREEAEQIYEQRRQEEQAAIGEGEEVIHSDNEAETPS